MKRNIIKLQKGSVSIEKETVREKKQSLKETQRVNELLSESLGLGIGIALPIAGGAILGTALDKLFNTAPFTVKYVCTVTKPASATVDHCIFVETRYMPVFCIVIVLFPGVGIKPPDVSKSILP